MKGLEYLNSLGPWTGSGEFDLANMRRIVQSLNSLQDLVPSVHIAGTNGKGSTAAGISAILGANGYNVGLNTSPHLSSINERFLINGLPIDNLTLNSVALDLKEVAERLSIQLTFHEGATLIAFLAFRALDWAVYEVGLGGRLDASNVLSRPELCIITSIALDHEHILGNDIRKIAWEKAGIIKAGVLVVVGRVPDEAFEVIEAVANEREAAVYRFGRDFFTETIGSKEGELHFSEIGQDFSFTSKLYGRHQLSNLACIIKSASLLKLDMARVARGLKEVNWPGRIETVVYRNKKFVLDCAHNLEGVQAFCEYCSYRDLKEEFLLFGVLKRSQVKEITESLAGLPFAQVLLVTPPSERAFDSETLLRMFSDLDCDVVNFNSDLPGALEYIVNSDKRGALVCGSIYLIGAVRELLNSEYGKVWSLLKK